ncbi:cytochrome P450 [Xylaria sp. FL1042]|nr:cytochrome P450 [Xylaria sp. FL1042]
MLSIGQLWNQFKGIPAAVRDNSTSTYLNQLLSFDTPQRVLFLVIGAISLLFILSPEKPTIPGAPVHGRRWRWEPTFWLQSRFTFGASKIISSGYTKYKDRPFVVKRFDANFNVLPNKYLDELRLVPETKLDEAQVQNIGHKWTDTTVVTESRLHVRTVQSTIATDLKKYLNIAKGELDYAWGLHIPNTRDWQEIEINKVVQMLVARMSAKVFVGHPACRNEQWLKVSVGYTMDVFKTAFTLRLFPAWVHPIVAQFIPARYRIAKHVKLAHNVLEPLIEKHADATRRRKAGEIVDEEDTLFNWMMDHGTTDENRVEKLVKRQALLTLASTHTTTSVLVSSIIEMCAHPEWIPVLREEVEDVIKELGPIGSNPDITCKQWLQRLEKLDSFFNEIHRMHPLLLLVPQRIALEPLTLKDGTHIPKGSRVCWAGSSHMNDPSVTPNPDVFDPMRSYAKRHSSPDQMNKHLAGQTSPDSLGFGYGKLACPGRHFAVNVTKMVLARLILDYEFKFPDNSPSRPKVLFADELLFTDPNIKIMTRLRQRQDE